jgi:hypothetical protein
MNRCWCSSLLVLFQDATVLGAYLRKGVTQRGFYSHLPFFSRTKSMAVRIVLISASMIFDTLKIFTLSAISVEANCRAADYLG